eukprot:scaffold174344_cov32-Tisochrysis_lutea.AAC.9
MAGVDGLVLDGELQLHRWRPADRCHRAGRRSRACRVPRGSHGTESRRCGLSPGDGHHVRDDVLRRWRLGAVSYQLPAC